MDLASNTTDKLCSLGRLDLRPLSRSDWGIFLDSPDKLFLLETSARPAVDPRAACAAESASRNANLSAVVLLLRSPFLDLSDRVTCRAYRALAYRGVHFRRMVPEMDFRGACM